MLKYPNVKAGLFIDEEVGCLGSSQADEKFFNDCSFVVQADRNQSSNDFIYHTNGVKCTSEEFDEAVEPYLYKYGFNFEYGSLTDVGELKINGLKVCCFNLAAGYLRAHSNTEVVSVPRFEDSIELLFNIIDNLGKQIWEHEEKGYYSNWYGYDKGSYDYPEYRMTQDFDDKEILSLGEFYDASPCNLKNKCRSIKQGESWYCPKCNVFKKIPNDLLELMV